MTITNKIIAAYLAELKARYAWARGEMGETGRDHGLEAAEAAARNACDGYFKLEGDAWFAALESVGFKPARGVKYYTCRELKEFCAGDA